LSISVSFWEYRSSRNYVRQHINDTETYDNGKKVVPSYLLDPVPVTKDSVQKVLVDSGYYTDADLK